MPSDVRKFAALKLAAFLIFTTRVLAGEKAVARRWLRPARALWRPSKCRGHWAYQPVKRVEPKAVKDASWVRNPIDRFVLAELEELGLDHAPPAGRVALIRRVTFDLTGRPPTPDEVAAFLADRRPDAYERVVDRLLASPEYGIRWGQHWLDLAHYADTNGFELDAEKPDAWRYRDWIIRSLSADLPYDRFLGAPDCRKRRTFR